MKGVEEMDTALNLKQKIGTGITPLQFINEMQSREMKLSGIPNTKEAFVQLYESFNLEDEEDRMFFSAEDDRYSNMQVLILCTDWCPDVIWNVPVLLRVMEQCGITTEILLMEKHMETMDLFLTDGGRAQPIAVLLHADSGAVLGRWGARPAYIQALMDTFKRTHRDKQSDVYQEELDRTYQQIGLLYQDHARYQKVILQELKPIMAPYAPPRTKLL